MASKESSAQQTCAYVIEQKKRKCRMYVKAGKRFCGEHLMLETTNDAEGPVSSDSTRQALARMPCPYDPKHSCFVSQLEKHMKKCNSRPMPQPEYIVKNINAVMAEGQEEEIKITLSSLSDEELMSVIKKVYDVHREHVGKLPDSFGRHRVLEATLESLNESRGSWRHVHQNSSILWNMAEAGILTSGDSTTYVEFGSGRGHLSYVLGQAVDLSTDSLLMIDKSSPRHKHENRYKLDGQKHASVERIRADIADIELWRVPHVQNTRRLVGTGKHLCGAATDLALHCLSRASRYAERTGLVQGVCIALCCHHQCTWRHYVGKDFFKEVNLTARDFAIMRTLTSWATCGARLQAGSAKPVAIDEHHAPKDEAVPPGRYVLLDLDADRREQIGRQCKQIIDKGRVAYLSGWLRARLVHYVETEISLENVLLLASLDQ